MHQAASRATPSQPKLTSGENRSRSNREMPAPCSSSEFCGIEPVQVERVGEVQAPDRAGLGDPRRERAVVPERVEGEHSPRPDVLEAGGPVGGDERGHAERDRKLQRGNRRGRRSDAVRRRRRGEGARARRRRRAASEAATMAQGSNRPTAPSSCSRTVSSGERRSRPRPAGRARRPSPGAAAGAAARRRPRPSGTATAARPMTPVR